MKLGRISLSMAVSPLVVVFIGRILFHWQAVTAGVAAVVTVLMLSMMFALSVVRQQSKNEDACVDRKGVPGPAHYVPRKAPA